ncbi:MAG TPA: TetR/AcrR family transcriptional regulator [Hyphomonas sp.]|nr:TetR/AcrR family transcriptional regulator [Hyphomonas sp.]HRI99245.1 TetR/AcrR family transcriptional regulator [Hyphomonas sp.]HRK68144.1 TetR/AcrR family transcriptional regulator [Hyphomonas sp.]
MNNITTPQKRTSARARIHAAALRTFADSGSAGVTVSEVAEAAGIARGTVYNNISDPENLFFEVASELSSEMIARVEATMAGLEDPALRLATGVRLFVRRASEERDWGAFLVRFGLWHSDLQRLLEAPPVKDAANVLLRARRVRDAQRDMAFVSMLSGATLAAMSAVIGGHQGWREAGSHTAEMLLRAAGVPGAQARRLANTRLPDLAVAAPGEARSKRRKTA